MKLNINFDQKTNILAHASRISEHDRDITADFITTRNYTEITPYEINQIIAKRNFSYQTVMDGLANASPPIIIAAAQAISPPTYIEIRLDPQQHTELHLFAKIRGWGEQRAALHLINEGIRLHQKHENVPPTYAHPQDFRIINQLGKTPSARQLLKDLLDQAVNTWLTTNTTQPTDQQLRKEAHE